MQYRRLGSTGLPISALSFGAWVTFGDQIPRDEARNLVAYPGIMASTSSTMPRAMPTAAPGW